MGVSGFCLSVQIGLPLTGSTSGVSIPGVERSAFNDRITPPIVAILGKIEKNAKNTRKFAYYMLYISKEN